MSTALSTQFMRLRSLIETRLSDTAPFLPGARPEDLDRLASTLGFPVPGELAELLQICNGQDDPHQTGGAINCQHFLTVDEIIDRYNMFNEVLSEMSEPLDQPSHYRWWIWSSRWIPFTGFDGDGFCIDTDPGELGAAGQVFFRPNVPELGEPIAASLTGFITRAVELIESGTATIEDGTTFIFDDFYGD